MPTKIAIWGYEQFDLILYLSRILTNLNKKVLIVDRATNDKTLKASIAVPINTSLEVVDYRGVDYTATYENNRMQKYDIILIYFDSYKDEMNDCEHVILITDLLEIRIKQFNESNLKANPILIVRDGINSRIKEDYIASRLESRIGAKCVYSIYQDNYDYKLKLDCYYNNIIKFRKLSKDFKEVLINLSEVIAKEQRSVIKSAYHRAERGK